MAGETTLLGPYDQFNIATIQNDLGALNVVEADKLLVIHLQNSVYVVHKAQGEVTPPED
jgi:hypothetical protein